MLEEIVSIIFYFIKILIRQKERKINYKIFFSII